MKPIKSLTLLIIISLFLNCSSSYKLQKESPLKFHKIEVQEWTANNKSGDSGIKMYFILPSDIDTVLDSVYYNNLKTNIYKGRNNNTYFANFKVESKRKRTQNNQFPFVLKSNECVVSYIQFGKTKYFKYSSVKVKS